MSKSITVCFIVLSAASVIHAAPQVLGNIDSNVTLRALKNECIRGIHSTFLEVMHYWQDKATVHHSPDNIATLHIVIWDGFLKYERLVEKVDAAPSMSNIEKREILVGFWVACEPEVTTEIALLTEQLMQRNRKSVTRA